MTDDTITGADHFHEVCRMLERHPHKEPAKYSELLEFRRVVNRLKDHYLIDILGVRDE